MCTSKFFHVLYIHMCVYVYIEILRYHTYSQNLSGNISVHYFPTCKWHHIFKNVNNNIIKNNITFIPSSTFCVFILSSSLWRPLSINRPDSPCTSTDVMPTECCWHRIKDTSGLQQLKWQENPAQTSPSKLKIGRICSSGPDEENTHHRLKSTKWKTRSSPQSFQPVARWTKLPHPFNK